MINFPIPVSIRDTSDPIFKGFRPSADTLKNIQDKENHGWKLVEIAAMDDPNHDNIRIVLEQKHQRIFVSQQICGGHDGRHIAISLFFADVVEEESAASNLSTRGSFILTRELAERAVSLMRPAILAAMESGLMKHDLYLVVMNPALKPWEVSDGQQAILYEEAFSDYASWESDYQALARGKGIATWRTSIPTNLLVRFMPYLLKEGDPIYGGSSIQDGIPVAAAGDRPWLDEWVSSIVASSCRALCIGEMEALKALPIEERGDFLTR